MMTFKIWILEKIEALKVLHTIKAMTKRMNETNDVSIIPDLADYCNKHSKELIWLIDNYEFIKDEE